MIEESFPTVIMFEGQPSVSSLDVAEHFGKRHDHVLAAIRKIMLNCPANFNAPNFRGVDYLDEKGQERPMYHLTRDAFTLLAMGFTGKRALEWKIKYIEAFNMLEAVAQNLTALPESPPKPKRKQKALPASDNLASQVEAQLVKVRFYIKEINDAEKRVADLFGDAALDTYGPYPSRESHLWRFMINAGCSTRALWTSIDFALKAIEESIGLRVEYRL